MRQKEKEIIIKIDDILYKLLHDNKNLYKRQYYKLLELEEEINKLKNIK